MLIVLLAVEQLCTNIPYRSKHFILIQVHFPSSQCSSCLSAISLSFLWWFVNYSFKHDWPVDWITGSIDHWARKKEFQWPLKPKCNLNDWRAEQPQQAEVLNWCRLKMHQSGSVSRHPSFLLFLHICIVEISWGRLKKNKQKWKGTKNLQSFTLPEAV